MAAGGKRLGGFAGLVGMSELIQVRGGYGRWLRMVFQERDQMLPQVVIFGMFKDVMAVAGASERHFQNVADPRGRAVGHHHDAI